MTTISLCCCEYLLSLITEMVFGKYVEGEEKFGQFGAVMMGNDSLLFPIPTPTEPRTILCAPCAF